MNKNLSPDAQSPWSHNLLTTGSCASDWSATIKAECTETINNFYSSRESRKKVTSTVTLWAVLASVVCLGAATVYQAPHLVQSSQEIADTVATERLTIMNY